MAKTKTLRLAMLRATTSFTSGFHGNPLEELLKAADAAKPDILVGPEFLFYNRWEKDESTPYTKRKKQEICEELAVKTKGILLIPGTFIWKKGKKLFNSAPVIFGGELKHEYLKYTDGGSCKIAEDHSLNYSAGDEGGLSFPWKGITIGLEICLDHYFGILGSRDAKTDLHLITSCGQDIYERSSTAREGGYAAICNGIRIGTNKVKMKITGKLFDWASENTKENADVYELEI